MKIYIATSWKNAVLATDIAKCLRGYNHEVDLFSEWKVGGRYTFNWRDDPAFETMTALEALGDARVKTAFEQDRTMLDWCELCLMICPCGRSSHLEGGYAKGQGKWLYMYGDFKEGELDVMYGFADRIFRTDQLNLMVTSLGILQTYLNLKGGSHV